MSSSTFELRILQIHGLARHTNWDDGVKNKKEIKMFQLDARTRKQAIERAKKYKNHNGKILSCRKVDIERSLASIEKLPLDNFTVYDVGNPYPTAIAMDEMVWKRNRRINDLQKHEKGIDTD